MCSQVSSYLIIQSVSEIYQSSLLTCLPPVWAMCRSNFAAYHECLEGCENEIKWVQRLVVLSPCIAVSVTNAAYNACDRCLCYITSSSTGDWFVWRSDDRLRRADKGGPFIIFLLRQFCLGVGAYECGMRQKIYVHVNHRSPPEENTQEDSPISRWVFWETNIRFHRSWPPSQ